MGRKEYKFLWFIENYKYCMLENGVAMGSPTFTIDGLEGSSWYLVLYPQGCTDKDRGNVSLFLRRSEKDGGPEILQVNCQLSILAVDGSVLHSRDFELKFTRNTTGGANQLVQTDEIHLRRKAEYLHKGGLSVCCKIWKGEGEGEVQNVVQISARSRILLEKISFLHAVENFSTLQPNVRQTIVIRSQFKEGCSISSSLYFTDCSCEEIMIEIVPSDADLILRKCKLSLLDVSGNITNCGEFAYGHDAEKISIHKLPLSLRREDVLKRKSEYLPGDKLSLMCECIFLTGLMTEAIEETLQELPSAVMKRKIVHAHSEETCEYSDIRSEYPSALEDMKSIYINQRFSDVELKTNTKSFKAHKNVLSARSPVFEAMLTSDMKEKITDCIHVDDLEDDTVQQLLLFIYSDSLENLQWKSAIQLYYAADKYQIGKLKAMSSSFLTENLSNSNASELLLLADTHSDSKLKKVVEDFIMQHEEQVFGSNGWEKLIETNPLLVIKTMHLKYKRKNEAN